MKEVWNVKPLGEVCRLVRGPFGGSLKKSIFVPDGYAVYEQQHAINNRFDEVRYFVDENKFNEMRRFELLPNDLIMSCSGTMGRVSIVPKDIKRGIINQALLKLTPPPKLLVNFLKLWMESDSFQDALKEYSAGAAIQNVASVDTLKKIEIPLPSVAEQHRIVDILDKAFEGVATAKANAEKNLQNALALFESHLQSVFAQRGEGWVTKPISQCFKIRSGDFLPGKAMVTNGKIDVYGGNGITGKHDQKNLSGENIIIGRVGAKCGNVRYVIGDLWLTDNAFFISECFQHFILAFLARLLRHKQLRDTANQTAQPVISYTTIKDVMLEFPVSKTEQKKIAEKIEGIEEETQRLEALYQQKLTALEELKKSLLHQAFNGQL